MVRNVYHIFVIISFFRYRWKNISLTVTYFVCSSPFRSSRTAVGYVGIAHLRFTCFHCRAIPLGHTFALHGLVVPPFPFLVLWLLLTSHGSLLLRQMRPSMRPHGISRQSFLVYLPDLHIRVTTNLWTSRLAARSSAVCALVSGSCSSGYDFAIPSSRPNLTI